MINILFVCTGNICRSPTAEGVLQKLVTEQGLADKFHIESAGTHDYHAGEAADKRTQLTAKKHGIDLHAFTARQIEREDFANFDYILAMDNYNIECLKSMCPPQFQHKITLFLSYINSNILSEEVPDPYYGEGDGFQYVYELILEASECFLSMLKEKQLTTKA